MDSPRPTKPVDATVVETKTPARRAPVPEKTDLERLLRVTGPDLLRKHAANIVLLVLLIAAAAMFFYNRQRNKAAEQAATNQNTAIAYDFATQARDLFNLPVFNDDLARQRQQKVRDVFSAVDLVVNSDAGPGHKAAAQLARAEVNWLLANAPPQSIATTQPALGFNARMPADYLADAEASYAEILTKYADQREYAANALIGLAAIAETRGLFDDAAKRYAQVIDDKSLRATYRDIAAARLKMLDEIRLPYTIATPASQPAGTSAGPAPAPTSMPASMPTTMP